MLSLSRFRLLAWGPRIGMRLMRCVVKHRIHPQGQETVYGMCQEANMNFKPEPVHEVYSERMGK